MNYLKNRKYQAKTEIISVVVVGSQHILDLRLFTFDCLADQGLEFFSWVGLVQCLAPPTGHLLV